MRRFGTGGAAGNWGWSADLSLPTHDHPGRSEVSDDGAVLDASSISPVVGLGAICGVDDRGAKVEDRSQSFWVSEFVRLESDRRVILHEDRGFSVGAPIGPGAGETVEAVLTRDEVVETVLAVVLPDPEDGEQHPWSWLAVLARVRGLDVTADDLRELPYEVILTDSVMRSVDRDRC